MDGGSPPANPILLPPLGIEERRSTQTLAVEDPAGQKAIRFLLDHYSNPIAVEDLVEASGVTRRQLTYLTLKELKLTPAKLLEDLRIEKACELLEDTDLSVEQVARDCGLGTALRLQRIFRKRFETSPRSWRKARRGCPTAAGSRYGKGS